MNKPANRPQLTKEEALQLAAPYNMTDKCFIIGIRGYYKNTMGEVGENDRGIYDDAICIVGPEVFKTFNGNTDPSINRDGIATLLPGVHAYKKGNHGISRPGGGYPALRPATPGEKLPVKRDGGGYTFGIAINIHKGSINSTSSEGCQTIYPDQWKDFINTVYALMDKYRKNIIHYVLIEQ